MSKTDKQDKPADDQPKKKGGNMKLIIGAVLLMSAGAGGVYGAMAAGYIGGGEHAEKEPDLPKLVLKGEEDPYAVVGKGADAANPAVEGEGGSEYRTSYYSFEEPFTSNLKNSASLIQVSLAASTRHDGRVIMWLEKHNLAVRSQILIELADTPEEDVYSLEGKERLQERLTKAINKILTDNEGFGGVDAVHFRAFLVQ